MKRLPAAGVVCLWALALAVSPAAAQVPLPLPIPGQTRVDPQNLQETRKAPFTITPSLTITGEYNDNIFLDNDNRKSDFILGFTPGLSINWESATYRLNAAYSFTAELFAKESEESHAFDRQAFSLDALWRVNKFVTLTLFDNFNFNTETNLISNENVSTGRDRSFGNTIGAGVAWQFDPLMTARGSLGWTTQRFDRSELQNSDAYRAEVGVDRTFARQVTGSLGYQFGYFDIEQEGHFTVHTPRVGVGWNPTGTISMSLSGGPSLEFETGGSSRVTPAITAGYRQRVPFGAFGFGYDKSISTAGGLGGTTDNQLISAFVDFTTLLKGLTIGLSPRYSIVESPHDSKQVDIKSFTVGLQAVYRVTEWVSIIGGYQFFRQRSDSAFRTDIDTTLANDADQSRVFFGIQFGYPIKFD